MYRSEKTKYAARRLDSLQHCGDDTLTKVSAVILDKLVFYDRCLKSWDTPSGQYTAEYIELSKKCCEAGIDMADAIVNELRILFLEPAKRIIAE
mgnify:CR=1 FL=1